MNINAPAANLDELKEMKVKLPMEQHLKLHTLKLLTGKTMSDAVQEALTSYLGDVLGAADA